VTKKCFILTVLEATSSHNTEVNLGHVVLMNSCLNAGAYKKMTSLKEKYPHLKVLLGMDGWKERVEKNYSQMAVSPSRRRAFISSVSHFLR
jgi:GH18 family chitinase